MCVPSEAPEDEGGELGEELSQPDILVVEGSIEQENDDAGEVNVGHHQQVELPEELQLLHVPLGCSRVLEAARAGPRRANEYS